MSDTGRPTKYDKATHDRLAHSFALLGATIPQIAEAFDVAESTVHLWMTQHPSFSEALKSGRLDADAKVAKTLYRSAIGKQKVTRTVEVDGVKRDENVLIDVEPDTTAAIFWLKNRQPEQWRDRREVSVSGSVAHLHVDALAPHKGKMGPSIEAVARLALPEPEPEQGEE